MEERPRGTELIVVEDPNVHLDRMGGRVQNEEIAALMATAVLEDPLVHFLLCQRS